MPDLVTHLASGYVAAIPLRQQATLRLTFLTGFLLPDLLTRPFYIIWPATYDFIMPMHTPIAYALVCWLITQLFADRNLRRTVMTGLFAGGLLHFAADALQRQFLTGYNWLFPICRCEWRWGLFTPEEPVRWLPLTVVTATLFVTIARGRQSNSRLSKTDGVGN